MRRETVILLETMLDHLTGEELGAALAALNDSPHILDAALLTGTGKKGRPAGLLQVICLPASEPEAVELTFRHTHTLGLRRQELERYVLERSPAQIAIAGATIAAKAHRLAGRSYARPEADAIRDLAAKLGEGAPGLRFRANDGPADDPAAE
ncbi:MAG: DUF111 family protein [Desulfovibrio sp.]|nr:DUF111 family protein [Desulfovibrio sp.]